MSNSNKTKLLLDVIVFAAFMFAMDPRASGIPVHEWMTLALAAVMILHLLLNWEWVAEFSKRLFTKGLNGARMNYILNWLLFVDGVLIMLSGVMISQAVAPSLGFTLPPNFTWRGLHSLSTNLSLILLGLHIALHWNWIVTIAKRVFGRGKSPQALSSFSIEAKDS